MRRIAKLSTRAALSPGRVTLLTCVCLFSVGHSHSDAEETPSPEKQLRQLIPAATAIDRQLFEKMARSQESPNASKYNDHSLTAELIFLNYKTAQSSDGQFRYLTEKTPKPYLMAKEMYRSIGGGRFSIVTHPVTMIQQNRITKLDLKVEGQSASGTFEFHVPQLYEGETDFTAEQTGDKWRITRLQMPKLKIDLKSDESGQWWRAEDLKGYESPICLTGHTDTVWSLSFSKDGQRLVSGSSDRSVRIWDVSERKAVLTIPRAHTANPSVPIEGGVLSVCFSPDEQRVATSSDDGTVKIWNASTGEQEVTIEVRGIVDEAVFSPDGQTILSSSSALEIWNAEDGKLQQTIREHSFPATDISPDGLKIVTGGADPKREDTDDDRKSIKLWDAKAGEPLATSKQHHKVLITDLAFSPDGKRIASCARDQTIRIWDAADLRQLQKVDAGSKTLQSVCWSPDGRWIVISDLSGTVRILEADTGNLRESLPRHPSGIRCVKFSPDGQHIVTAGDDGVIRLWSVDSDPVSN